jgi:hypothetical protein
MQPKVEKLVNFVRQPAGIAPKLLGDLATVTNNYVFPEE